MKKTGLWLLVLVVMVCGACGGAAPEASQGTLVVGDGTTSKTYTVADLQELPVSESVFNEVTYKGVALSALLGDAGFDAGALKAVKAVAADGYTVNYDPAVFQRADVLVAYGTAEGSLTAEDGVLRMVLPGEEGKLNMRMLTEIKVVP